MKLERADSLPQKIMVPDPEITVVGTERFGGYSCEILSDGKRRIDLKDVVAEFRSPTAREVLSAGRNARSGTNSEKDRFIALESCTKWGDRASVTLGELMGLRAKQHRAISQLIQSWIQGWENPPIEEGENYEITVSLPGGNKVVLRDAKATDIDFIEKAVEANFDTVVDGSGQPQRVPNLAAMAKIGARLCLKWGDGGGISEDEMLNKPVKDVLSVMEVISKHFLNPE
jgi:hypothetical protein